MERERLEYAAEGFLTVLRRAHSLKHPDQESMIKTLNEYSPEDRGVLLKAVGHALSMTGPSFDESFLRWKILRQSADPVASH